MRTSRYTYIRLLLHLLIWGLAATLLFLYPAYRHNGADLPPDFTIKQIVHLLLMLTAYYVNGYLLIPSFLLKKKYIAFALAIVILIFSSAYILATVEHWLGLKEQMSHVWNKKPERTYFDMFGFITTVITLGISTSITLANKLNKDSRERLKLEKEKVKAELALLKAQIHPHFFFNTLNSIYALSFTDAEASRKVLTRLSGMMRYLLYETAYNKTELAGELSFIRNYIEIMTLRLNKNTSLELNLPENVIPMQIAPMILMPYIENVFKHGVNERDNNKLTISINQYDKGVELMTRNRITHTSAFPVTDRSNGIGMQNTLRRLELIYKNKYRLDVNKDAAKNEFELTLKIELQ